MASDSGVLIDPRATVDSGAQIGRGTKIWHFCHVMSGARIGEDCVLGQNVFVGGGAVVGDRVKIQNNVSVYDAVTLEDEVFCGPSMVFTNVINPRAFIERKTEYQATLVRRGATLGPRHGRGRCGGDARCARLCPDARGSGPPGGLELSLRGDASRIVCSSRPPHGPAGAT